MIQVYTPPHHPHRVLIVLWDLLACAGGAGAMLVVLRWLADVWPFFERFGWP